MTTPAPRSALPDKITPPWSDEQIDALNTYQRSGFFHPFTCANRGDGKHYEYGGDLGELVATRDGWVCRDCDYTQAWAHAAMADKGMIESYFRDQYACAKCGQSCGMYGHRCEPVTEGSTPQPDSTSANSAPSERGE